MSTITKRELVSRVTSSLLDKGVDITQQDVYEIVKVLMEQITQSLAEGDQVVLRNFGNFEVKETKAKVGRNPKNPEIAVIIPARAGVKFKPGKEMKEKVACSLQLIRERDA
jgi:DNA-binding protein HU-beta/integration host factor subunit alpha